MIWIQQNVKQAADEREPHNGLLVVARALHEQIKGGDFGVWDGVCGARSVAHRPHVLTRGTRTKPKILRGFEPRSLDSESRVLTVTP